MSGIKLDIDTADPQRRLIEVLDRQVPLDSLAALSAALKPPSMSYSLLETAICLDTNVFLRLRDDDIIDYLRQERTAPLILPGQAIQEFWNNQLQAVQTISASVKYKFDELKKEISKISPDFGDYAQQFELLISNLSNEYGYIYDNSTLSSFSSLLDMLLERAIVAYAPRAAFCNIALQRKMTKTPPGFKDSGDGDFFVWVDMLTALQRSLVDGCIFNRVVLVSHDQKPDWSRGGTAHPILVAEVNALFKVPFEIWTVAKLRDEIKKAT